MKKTIFVVTLLSVVPAFSEEGLIIEFMKKQDEALKFPSTQDLALTAAVIAGATATGFVGHATAIAPQTQVRSLVEANPGLSLLTSPYLWFIFGGLTTVFGIYHFIGHEMSIIIETKSTLLSLEKQVELWQKELLLLKENQINLAAKIKDAIEILDTITPLVTKLVKNSQNAATTEQVTSIKKELTDLKNLVHSLASAQGTTVSQTIKKKSKSLFGFAKKQRRMMRKRKAL